MVKFRFRKRRGIIDLTEHLRKQEEKVGEIKSDIPETSDSSQSSGGAFGFLSGLASGASSSQEDTSTSDYSGLGSSVEEKRKRFAKRLMEMTSKIEDFSNQIYHLQQRIEVLEKKLDVNRFG